MQRLDTIRRGSALTATTLITLGLTVTLTGLAAWAVTYNAAKQPRVDSALMAVDADADEDGRLVVYCGRSASLVRDLLAMFEAESGIDIEVKYAQTGPLATLILEEGDRTPADVFFAQDPGGLGVLAEAGRFATLPDELLERVDAGHRDPDGRWIGLTGRARTLAYSKARLSDGDLPVTLAELTDPTWRGRVGWAPANASFQAMVTAMRHEWGEAQTEQWLRDMMSNGAREYPKNTPIIQAIADGEIDLGLVNHYYLYRFIAQHGPDFPVANYYMPGRESNGDLGSTMLVAGVGILEGTKRPETAAQFVSFLLGDVAQSYFADQTYEYPLAAGQSSHEMVPPLDELPLTRVNLHTLADLQDTVAMLRTVGALP